MGSAWSIRLFEANDYSDEATIDFMDNFTKGKSRQLDSLRTYNGMYGIDNYLVWNIHKDLPNYDFSTVALDLTLFMYKSTDIPYFQEFYRIQDIKYNPNKSQYTVYAISETTEKLRSKLIKYGVTSLSYKENRTAKEVLIETIEKNKIFYLRFHDDTVSTEDMIHYQYRYFDIDPEWTVLDLIEYIADDNKYEWCVTTFVDKETNHPYYFLHIGHELKADEYMNATKKFNIEDDNISDSVYTKKITTNGSPMQPLAHWEENLRCLWSKHSVGKGGADNSKGCFAPIGMGHFDKVLYLKTLEGEIEKNVGYSMLNRRKVRIPSIGIGNILADEGLEYIDKISIQKNPPTYSIREPHNIIINRGDDIVVQHQLEQITRSTSYLDHRAGLLFPSPKLVDDEENKISPPNSLVFHIDGKRESAVLGPYVLGDGKKDENGNKTLTIPVKDKGDFRLQFPNGWCLYVNEDGDTYLNIKDIDPGIKPEDMRDIALAEIAGLWFIQKEEDVIEYRIGVDDDNYFYMRNKENNMILQGDGSLLIQAYKSIYLTSRDPSQCTISLTPEENGNKGGILIQTYAGKIQIKSADGGNIEIDTSGNITIGSASSLSVKIAGGGKKLSHGTHTHQVTPGPAIPGPPATATPTSDNTIKTEAD